MAGSASDYLENAILNAVLNQTSFVVSTPYVALCTVAPTDSSGGTEVSGGSYARAASTTSWPTATTGTCSNDVAIAYPTATADWGNCLAFKIMDASTGGNMLYWGDITTPRTILNGDTTPTFAIGALVINQG